MNKMSEKRKAGEYEVIHEMCIGEKEVIIGELSRDGEDKYMCAYYESNVVAARYTDVVTSGSYFEIISVYAERIKEQAEKEIMFMKTADVSQEDQRPFDYEKIKDISYKDNLEGKVIVINPYKLRREYRAAIYQLKLCIGGFGALGNARGSACMCRDLFTGKSERYERYDVLGTVDKKDLPQWASEKLKAINADRKINREKMPEWGEAR